MSRRVMRLQKHNNLRLESEHRSSVRQIPAFHTVATLCQLASVSGVGGQPSPVEVLKETTLTPLRSFQAQERPERGGKTKGRALRQVKFSRREVLRVAHGITSYVCNVRENTRLSDKSSLHGLVRSLCV